MLSRGLSISQIARQRGLTETTIVGHLERMTDQGVVLDLEHLLPSAERLDKMKEAFHVCGAAFLRPIWEFLGAQFTYDELRLVRLYLRQEGWLSD